MLKRIRNNLILSIVVLVFTLFIGLSPFYNWLDKSIYDLFIYLNITQNTSTPIVMIDIDDKSIEKIGTWPWSRDIYAKLLKILYDDQAKSVGIYLDFSLPSDVEKDKLFLEAIKKYPVTILNPYTFTAENPNNLHWQELMQYANYGHDIIQPSKDGIVRNYSLVLNQKPSFALSVLNKFNSNNYKYIKDNNILIINNKIIKNANNDKLLINYKRLPYSYNIYSFSDVLDNKVANNAFKDKIVLIGVTKDSLTEFYSTPLSKKQAFLGDIPPVYIQAQVINALLEYPFISQIDYSYIIILLVLIIPCCIWIIEFQGIIKQILLSFILPLMLFTLSFGLFKDYNLWFSPAIFVVAFVLMFIILAISQVFKITNFLDKYISELTQKTSSTYQLDPSVDNKLMALKEITDLIEKDRSIFDTILSSVNSVIILFNQNGNIIYSNADKKKVNLEEHLQYIEFDKILLELSKENLYKENIYLNQRCYEFLANQANETLYVGVFNDITDMVKMNDMKSSIIRMLSHEVKSPLYTILLCTDYLNNVVKGNAENYVNRIVAQTEFIQTLIDSFLELNKLELTDFKMTCIEIDINKLILTLIENFKVFAGSKNISLETNIDSSYVQLLQVDEKYMTIALKNLIDNAIKYSPENKKIYLNISKEENEIIVCIKDEGYGMPKEDLPKLFNKFYRVKTENTINIPGTGLGLSFVKRIVELHKGNITVDSELDKGTEFKISLPL